MKVWHFIVERPGEDFTVESVHASEAGAKAAEQAWRDKTRIARPTVQFFDDATDDWDYDTLVEAREVEP